MKSPLSTREISLEEERRHFETAAYSHDFSVTIDGVWIDNRIS
jgi:hypothetical protein